MKKLFVYFFLSLYFLNAIWSQSVNQNLVYVDKKGVLRYTATKREATFFGVNYTVPFAYGYRSHKALGIDPEKAIDADVAHMARLGLNAFRVHVWDVEISDSLGNLLVNEHLRLFDYLLHRLKQYHIRILVTPIAFWGNGYPEPDIRTNGFAHVYTKGGSVVKEEAFRAQENYLKQFFTHENPYTKLTYRDDPDIIAVEINNEPHHSGPKEKTTEYVNRMAAAVRSTSWTKPVFYNISESPSYADAVAKARVDGHSFQWYPTGLVANHEQKGNFLPNVDRYHIPFIDTIPAFRNRARMVYEFDAGDVRQPIMYPAMARSYRTAGFQWATQFAYDPLYTAHANTEYQTHYLNLVYTPAKAISLLIAGKAFHRLPANKSYGTYPADTLFDVFRVSYRQQLSEMNSEEEFYYSGNTATMPKAPTRLKHLAGVGSSPLVHYEGLGAYFLDKIADGVWRLEVMPDAIPVKDPFEKASPKKTVTKIAWRANRMVLLLPGMDEKTTITGTAKDTKFQAHWNKAGNWLQPGVYFITAADTRHDHFTNREVAFYAPKDSAFEPDVVHQPFSEVSANQSFVVSALLTGIDTTANVSVELRHSTNRWKTVPMQLVEGYRYEAIVPAEMVGPGMINYRVMVKMPNGERFTYPGGFKGDPYAWDEYRNESWQTFVANPESPVELFKPTTDRNRLMFYSSNWRNNTVAYTAAVQPKQLTMKATIHQPGEGTFTGWQYFFRDKIQGRILELSSVSKLVVRAKASQPLGARLSLITADADAYATPLPLTTEWREIEIPLTRLQKTAFLLLPRPYPGFQPLYFTTNGERPLTISDVERLEFTFGEGVATSEPVSVEVDSVFLKK